jgi:hypothetical protein
MTGPGGNAAAIWLNGPLSPEVNDNIIDNITSLIGIRAGADVRDGRILRNRVTNAAGVAFSFAFSSDANMLVENNYADSEGTEFSGLTNSKAWGNNAQSGVIVGSGMDINLGTSNKVTAGTFEVGHASDTTLGRTSAGVANIEGKDLLMVGASATLTSGYKVTAYDIGTITTGTVTPDAANGNAQKYVNNGAHTLAPPSADCQIVIQMTNDASAGAITTSGFTKVAGDVLTTTDGDDFLLWITRINGFSRLYVEALQ